MAFAALLQHAEAVRHEVVRVIGQVVARIVDSEGTGRFDGDAGCRRRRVERRNHRLHRHRRRWQRFAEFLDAHQNVPLMKFIFYTHILQQEIIRRCLVCTRMEKDTPIRFF